MRAIAYPGFLRGCAERQPAVRWRCHRHQFHQHCIVLAAVCQPHGRACCTVQQQTVLVGMLGDVAGCWRHASAVPLFQVPASPDDVCLVRGNTRSHKIFCRHRLDYVWASISMYSL